MKIGFDAKRLYANYTGLGNYSRTLVKNIRKFFPENEYFLYTPKIKQSLETEYFIKDKGFHTYKPETLFKSYWRSFSIAKQLQKDQIELFHGLSNEIPLSLKNTGIKSVVSIHDLIYRILPDTYSLIDRKLYDMKYRNSCINADKIIAISRNTKKDIVNLYGINPDKIEVIYQACNPLFYETPDETQEDEIVKKYALPQEYMLYVGTVEKRKNLKLIINAYNYLPDDLKIPLIVIGDGKKYKEEVQKQIVRQKIGDKIIRLSNLKNNYHLQSIYRKASVFIYPSFYEGFGIPVVEALLSKTPVITSNVSSLPEAGGPDTLYINPDNAEELAQAIIKVLTDTRQKERMINKGYKYAMENFSAEKVSEKLMNCYQDMLKQ